MDQKQKIRHELKQEWKNIMSEIQQIENDSDAECDDSVDKLMKRAKQIERKLRKLKREIRHELMFNK